MAELIGVSEAAERFGLHPETIRRMIHAGRIKGYRKPFSNAFLVSPQELEQLSKPTEVQPTKPAGAQLTLDLDKAKRGKGKK